MNEETCCITNEGKTVRSKWKNDDCHFLWALHSVYKKSRAIYFHTLLALHRSVAGYKYFRKLINEYENIGLRFFKNTVYLHNHFNKVIKF